MTSNKICARCGEEREDKVDSDICGSCADDLRDANDAYAIAMDAIRQKEEVEHYRL